MKAKFTRGMLCTPIRIFLFALLFTQNAYSQAPIYKFKNPQLVSGTDRQAGAKYRFSNVRTGVDAHVTIDSMTSGIQLMNIDRTADGYSEAFQPEYRITNGKNAYILFTISFVKAGTSTPQVQPSIEVSGLDIDGSTNGGRSLYEMNGIDMAGGVCSFNLTNSHIVVAKEGSEFVGRNITGALFGALVDTSAYEVMFTVASEDVVSFKYRVGANNQTTNSSTRYASLYFKSFPFPDGAILSAPFIRSFNGVLADGKTKLNWELADHNKVSTVEVERASSGNGEYRSIALYWVNMEGNNQSSFQYTDASFDKNPAGAWYRLRVTGVDGKVQYSHVLRFQNEQPGSKNELMLYPTLVNSGVNLQYTASRSENASFEVYDMSGRMIQRTTVALAAGQNNIRLNTLDGIPRGQFVSTLRTSEGIASARFTKL